MPSPPNGADLRDTPGVARNVGGVWKWWLSNDLNANVHHHFAHQPCCSTPLVGDWDGDTIDSPGVNVGGNRWMLTDGYDDIVDYDLYYGLPGDVPLVGDWNGDGRDTIAVWRGNCFHWKESLAGGEADNVTCFGNHTDTPVVGDWDGNGTDTPGVYRNGIWWLSNGYDGSVWHAVGFGITGDRPLPGDWNGNGVDTPGVQRGGVWYLSNDFAGTVNHQLWYGNPGDVGVAGDWDPDPIDFQDVEGWTSDETSFTTQASGPTHAERYLVWRYAPLVFLHPDEANFPASPLAWFIKHSSLRWAIGGGPGNVVAPVPQRGQRHVSAIRLGEPNRNPNPYVVRRHGLEYFAYDFTRPYDTSQRSKWQPPEEGFFLDLVNNNYYRGGERPDEDRVPLFYHFGWSSGAPGFITYWFFYPYNDGVGPGNHEGDWERVSVRLDANGNATHMALFRHNGYKVVTWAQISQVPRTDHPIVFSAEGSHASYGRALVTQHESCTGGHIADSTKSDDPDKSPIPWRTWEWVHNVQRQPWYGFGGAWGEIGEDSITTGPSGPGWKRPDPPQWTTNCDNDFIGSSASAPPPAGYAQTVLADGPVGYWRLGESIGDRANDESSREAHATYLNGLNIGEPGSGDEYDPSVTLDGVDDYVRSDASSTLTLGNDLTIEAWVKPELVTGPTVRQTIYGHNDATNQPQLELGGTGGRNRVSLIVPGIFVAETNDDAVVPGVWQHVVYTRTGPGATHHIYVNGVEKPLVINSATEYVDAASTKLIGARTATLQRFQGGLDEIAVYDGALTQDRILEHYRAGVSPYARSVLADGPLAYWRLGEVSGTIAADLSRNSRHASYLSGVKLGTGGALNDVDPAAEFDGVDDVVQANAESTFAVGNTITIEAWIKPATSIGAARQTIYGRNNSSDHPMFQFGGFAGANRLCVVIPSGIMAETVDNAVTPGVWQHVVYTRSGPGATHRIYVNGVEQQLVTNAATTYVDSPSAKLIGGRNTTTARFQGAIDEVAVYATALTPQQISQHYAASGR